MDNSPQYILESYLITGQDYADFQVALRRMKTCRLKVFSLRILGMALILASLLGKCCYIYQTPYHSLVFFGLFCLGIGICLYYDYGMPYLVRRSACRYFDRKFKKMVANATKIDACGISFVSEIGNTQISYQKLCRVYEDKRVILLEANGELRFLPKRVLTLDEYEGVRRFLKRALQENYVQEGVC